MVSLLNWLPFVDRNTRKPLPEYVDILNGKILAEASLLGPFFRFSSFAEDEPKLAEKYFLNLPTAELNIKTVSMVAPQIRPLISASRVSYRFPHQILSRCGVANAFAFQTDLLAICQSLVVNVQSRKFALAFFENMLRVNTKRANIQVSRRPSNSIWRKFDSKILACLGSLTTASSARTDS